MEEGRRGTRMKREKKKREEEDEKRGGKEEHIDENGEGKKIWKKGDY